MKIRPSVILIVAFAALLLAFLLWLGKKPQETVLIEPHIESITNASSIQPVVASNLAKSLAGNAVAITTNSQTSQIGSKEQTMAEALSAANDVPILFYGKLQDQFGNPVVGAEVFGTTTIINGVATGANRVSAVSDSSGLFQLNAGNGQSLGIMPKKAGYALATTSTSFNYSHLSEGYYVPDQNNPTVINMWKLQGAEPLVNIDQRLKLPYTDASMNYDLITGKIVTEGGDIQVTVTRPPGIVSLRNRQDWSVEIDAIGGGLIDSSGKEAITYAAPESGYQPKINLIFSTNAPYKWFGGFDQGLFVSSRNGMVYSKIGFSFVINQNPDGFMYLTIGGVANTNSSRNWEADPNTMNPSGQ